MNNRRVSVMVACGLMLAAAKPAPELLPRRAPLGLTAGAVPSQLAERIGGSGSLVQTVAPLQNAERLGVKAGDVILAINGKSVASPADVNAISGHLGKDDPIKIKLWRDGRSIVIAGKASARPFETYDDATVAYGAVAFGGGLLRDILVMPKGRKDAPVVFLIQGYPCLTVEPSRPDHGYRQLAAGLVARGIGVYRVDKPGVGDSKGLLNCSDIDFDTELAAFKAGYRALIEKHDIAPDRIFMFGHSMGGLEAPLIAAEDQPPRGVAIYGGVVRNWFDYAFDTIRLQPFLMSGNDPVRTFAFAEEARETLRRFYLDRQAPEALAKENPRHGEILRTIYGWTGGAEMAGRHYSYWQDIAALSLADAWRKARTNVLSLYGEADLVAVNDEDHKLVAEIVNHYRPGTARYVELPKTEHGMKIVGSPGELRRSIQANAGRMPTGPFNQRIVSEVADWIAASMAAPPVVERFAAPDDKPASQIG